MINPKMITEISKNLADTELAILYGFALALNSLESNKLLNIKSKNNEANPKKPKNPHSTVIKQSDESDEWEQELPDVSHIPTYAEWEQSQKPAPFMLDGKPFSLI